MLWPAIIWATALGIIAFVGDLERLRRRPSGGDDHVLAAEFDIRQAQPDVGFSDQ
jgi:hypothetical protein